MEFWTKRAIKAAFLPGGVILLLAISLLESGWVPISPAGVNFFYYSVFIAATLLAWRFHTRRLLFCVMVLLLGHHAIQFFAEGRGIADGPGQIAFEAVAVLIPIDFILLTFFPERSSEPRTLLWFLLLLFLESVFVAAAARPGQPPPAFLHFTLISLHHSGLPQPAMLIFAGAIAFLLVRLLQFHKPTESGMLWSLIAVWLGLQAGGASRMGTAYFGVAALALAGSIVENSYSLAYHDELTGLSSRRAFNDALLRLKPPYAIAAVDIDHFKSINDAYGHDTGDQVLRLVASKIARVGGGGEAFRIGGEEFTILFPGRTAKEVADYLELLRLNIENCSFRMRSGDERRKIPRDSDRRTKENPRGARQEGNSRMLSVTISIGLAECLRKSMVEEVIQLADKALYRAKQGGRNRIVTAAAMRRKSPGLRH